MSAKGGPVLTLSLPGGGLPPAPRQLRHWLWSTICNTFDVISLQFSYSKLSVFSWSFVSCIIICIQLDQVHVLPAQLRKIVRNLCIWNLNGLYQKGLKHAWLKTMTSSEGSFQPCLRPQTTTANLIDPVPKMVYCWFENVVVIRSHPMFPEREHVITSVNTQNLCGAQNFDPTQTHVPNKRFLLSN